MTEAQALAIARQTDPAPAGRSGARARFGWSVATLAVAALLILLTWTNTLRAIHAERHAASRHALASLTADVRLAAAGFDHRLTEAEALGAYLALDAARAGVRFDLATALATAPLRLPGGARAIWTGPDGAHHIAGSATGDDGARAPAIRLTHPLGPAGTLRLIVPLRALMAPMVVANLPEGAVLALLGTRHGRVRFVMPTPDAAHPSPGAWVLRAPERGPIRPAPGAPRILLAHATVPGRHLAVAILLGRRQALQPVGGAATGTTRLAIAISALIGLAALVVLGEIEATLRRERRLARDRRVLAEANAALARAKTEADAKTAQLEGLLAGLPVGVLMMDAAHRLVAWNPQVAALSGLPPALLRVGTDIEAMLRAQVASGEFGPDLGEAEVARRLGLHRAGRGYGRFERERPDGHWVEIRREPLQGGGFVALFTDITERHRANRALTQARAEAETANAAKSRFVAMVSHEIRTPLQALLGGLDMLAQTVPSEAALLAGMTEAGTTLHRLLDDILDVSRFEAGRLAIRPASIDPRATLAQTLAVVAPAAAARGVALSFAPAPDLPAIIQADPERLCQIAVNLLTNAVKFAHPGTVRLDAGRLGAALRVAVTDPGPPIPAERRGLLFQPFSRAGAEGGSGTGLGLAICRDLVSAMGGEIGHCLTPDGTGNVFWFTLPAERPIAAAPSVTPGRRILLAEDVAASRLVTATMLRRDGHEVIEVGDGAAALREAGASGFDLVLMDLDLPVLDGMGATRGIRALPGPRGAVPIVALSGHIGAAEQTAALAAGVSEILAKPAARAVLQAAIDRHVPGAGGGSVLAPARLAELRAFLAPERLAEVAEECLGELAARLTRLRAAQAADDRAEAIRALHAMAGLAGGYGLAEFERIARAAMVALREGRAGDPPLQPGALDDALERASREIRAWASG